MDRIEHKVTADKLERIATELNELYNLYMEATVDGKLSDTANFCVELHMALNRTICAQKSLIEVNDIAD